MAVQDLPGGFPLSEGYWKQTPPDARAVVLERMGVDQMRLTQEISVAFAAFADFQLGLQWGCFFALGPMALTTLLWPAAHRRSP